MKGGPRVALVHDWLVGMRGGEKCLEAACEAFPEADVFTLVHSPGAVSPAIERHRIETSMLQRIPGIERRYRSFLPLFPTAIERFDLSSYDVVLSLSHAAAKGAIPALGARHACYCFSPMRYVWDLYGDYFPRRGLRATAIAAVATYLRTWDVASTARIDEIAAISEHVRRRIARYYRRDARVLHPPVEDAYFEAPLAEGRGEYLLAVSALVPYKRMDVAIEASRRVGKPLWIVGSGPEERRLRAGAPASVRFLGWQPAERLPELYRGARALVFPGIEDFGIAPLEAQAVGRPVVGLAKGGLVETVRPLETGILYPEPTVEGLVAALGELDAREGDFDPAALRRNAERFRWAPFRDALRRFALGEESPSSC